MSKKIRRIAQIVVSLCAKPFLTAVIECPCTCQWIAGRSPSSLDDEKTSTICGSPVVLAQFDITGLIDTIYYLGSIPREEDARLVRNPHHNQLFCGVLLVQTPIKIGHANWSCQSLSPPPPLHNYTP